MTDCQHFCFHTYPEKLRQVNTLRIFLELSEANINMLCLRLLSLKAETWKQEAKLVGESLFQSFLKLALFYKRIYK